MGHEAHWGRTVVTVTALAALGVFVSRAEASGGIRIKSGMARTGVDPDARGEAQVKIDRHQNEVRGKLDVKVRGLAGRAEFEVVLGGVRIGTLATSRAGSGRVRFHSSPRGSDDLLGADPRGKSLEVRNSDGDDVLETEIPDDTLDPTKIRCCLADDDQPECEDRTPEECTAQGGVNLGAGSCLPNPCEATTPLPGTDIVCCIPDDSGPECEDRTPAGCSAEGGVNLGVGVCAPNPCGPTSPLDPATIQCCLPSGGEVECEDRTPELCAAQGGTDMGAGTCSPSPCPQPAEVIRCCLADDSGAQCEDRTADQCAAAGGTDIGPGSCTPNPCA